MSSNSETGHAKNVANFDQIIASVFAYGETYNPSKTSIQLTALQDLAVEAKSAISAVNKALPAYSNAVAAREVAFLPLSKLATRLLNSLKATDASAQVIDNAKTLVRKLQGARATPKKTEEEKAALAADGKSTKEISASQMSYDSRLNSFDQFIQLLASITQYTPNETELQVETLQARYNELNDLNATVIAVNVPLSNARIARNDVLYKENAGLVDIATDTKIYIKSVYGAGSPQYNQVSKLAFKAIN